MVQGGCPFDEQVSKIKTQRPEGKVRHTLHVDRSRWGTRHFKEAPNQRLSSSSRNTQNPSQHFFSLRSDTLPIDAQPGVGFLTRSCNKSRGARRRVIVPIPEFSKKRAFIVSDLQAGRVGGRQMCEQR
jgi:hypothetical protein